MSNNVIRKQRLIDLRNALNKELTRRKLTNKTFVDSDIATVSNINEIRTGIDSIKVHTYTDTLVQNRTVIKEIHFSELESIINTLSSHSGDTSSDVSDCAGGCTGLCISCTGDCYSGCETQSQNDCGNQCVQCNDCNCSQQDCDCAGDFDCGGDDGE
jgi:hypothetical protein